MRLAVALLAGAAAMQATSSGAAPAAEEGWSARVQATYVGQVKPSMRSPYAGPNSLSGVRERSYSLTATAAFGVRSWPGGELYFDAEGAQGQPLSGLTGLGGFTNGEMGRSTGPQLHIYRARLFVRHTVGLGGAREALEPDVHQLAGRVDRNRIVLTLGNLAATDLFDRNAYSHDPRTQFMNWALVTHGAYDFAADARGYSWGAAAEWLRGDWALRAGRFAVPRLPNQQQLDPRVFEHFGDQAEVERAHRLAGRAGRVRALAFRMRARMARFDDAVTLGAQTASAPDIGAVRTREQIKWGWGASLEQEIAEGTGVFVRYSRADGRTETYAYTEIDRSLSAGVSLGGRAWDRADDTLGLAFARNALSPQRRAYLAAGGISFFIGDGRLAYAPELVAEAYYRWQLARGLAATVDLQRIARPAYNADRGPATTLGLRVHAEY